MPGHCFDLSKEGYVNLFVKNGSGKRHGDDRLMVKARSNFLDKGYYAPLRDEVAKIIGEGNVVLDAGCGEGYYTSAFAEKNTVCGIDISKDALRYAAKRCSGCEFAVASIADIPLKDGAVDCVVSIFAPDSREEFLRVLKNGGRLITVTPMEGHLWQLKQAVYDSPYKNPAVNLKKEGFILKSEKELKFSITLDRNEDIISLFKMTPYYYKTSADDQAKLLKVNSLTTDIQFSVAEYLKN